MNYQKKSELLQQFLDAWLGGVDDNALHILYHKIIKPQVNELHQKQLEQQILQTTI